MLKDLFAHVCIVITFLFIGGSVFRRNPVINSVRQKLLLGFFAGILGSLLMVFTIRLTPTVILDFRHITILISALYGGPISTVVSVIIICLSRVLFIHGSAFSLLISVGMMVLIGIFAITMTKLKLSDLEKWIYMYIFSMITITIGFLFLLGISKEFYLLMGKYWTISIISGAFIYFCANFITQSNITFNEMKKLSTTDFLTGLHNVRHFDTALKQAIEKSKEHCEKLSLLVLDIDFFKEINDSYGHPAGDYVLRNLGVLLSKCARSFDIVSRTGGEEFSVLLLNCDHTQAVQIATRIRDTVESHKFILQNGVELNITISIGAATYLETTHNPDQLVAQADKALYKAKNTGRNTVCSSCCIN